ncbi:MAG: hypothetical protein WDO74_20685 [Pseudomonadota bacterium]
MPLLRNFGSLTHFLEPLVVARGLLEAAPRGSQLNDERTLLAAGGFDTSLGQRSTRQALALNLRAGALAHAGSTLAVGAARASADARLIGLAQSFALLGESPAMVSLSRLRVGSTDGLHLLLRADGASNGSPRAPECCSTRAGSTPRVRSSIATAGARAPSSRCRGLAPSTRRLRSTTTSRTRELLATWGGLGYRHPCGCLAVAGFVGHRVGRGGFDAWLGFDLAP